MVKAVESKNFGSFLTISRVLSTCTTLWLHCLAVRAQGTNLAQIFPFFKLSCKIYCTMILGIPIFSIIQQPIQPSLFTTAATWAMFTSVFFVAVLLLCSSSLNYYFPTLNWRCQSLTVARDTPDSPSPAFTISRVPAMIKPNLAHFTANPTLNFFTFPNFFHPVFDLQFLYQY